MFTARITRKVGDEIVKQGITTEDLSDLLSMIVLNFSDNEILEIHIVRGK